MHARLTLTIDADASKFPDHDIDADVSKFPDHDSFGFSESLQLKFYADRSNFPNYDSFDSR